MEYLIICSTAFFVSIIALISGFGLGTILMPIFAIFFPLELAISAVAIIHLANSICQALLVGKFAKWPVVIQFGLPAAVMSLIGAALLSYTSKLPPLLSYTSYGTLHHSITITGIIVGILVIVSALFTLHPFLARLQIPMRYIPLGGVLSGFFGGLSGSQGALRSAFLINSGLNKQEFVGTSALCSIIVDVARLIVYGFAIFNGEFGRLRHTGGLIVAASLVAFVGSYIGSKWLPKMPFTSLKTIVGTMLILIGFVIFLGLGSNR